MRQFDVYPNPSPRSRAFAPFVVVLQSHLLNALPTVLVAPMLRGDDRAPYTQVSVSVVFQGEMFIVSAAEMSAIDVRGLGRAAGDLRDAEDEIRRAIERVLSGF